MKVLILTLLLLPVAGALSAAYVGRLWPDLARKIALGYTLVCLLLAGCLAVDFLQNRATPKSLVEAGTFQPDHAFQVSLLRFNESSALQLSLGIDGLNIWLIVLTALLMVSSVLGSWTSVTERANEFYAWLLLLEAAMIGVFLAFDLVLFYVFFELTLVPLFFLIGIWGGAQRQHAARKFFIFTLAGSLITLLGVLSIVVVTYQTTKELTFSLPRLIELVNVTLPPLLDPQVNIQLQIWVFLALMVGFAVKVPLVPVHTWLPLAHVEAPTAGSVLLAGVLLKLGTYGFLRICVPLTPWAAYHIGFPLISTLSVIGIIYGALCAMAQDDIKKLVAYSSVSHLGYCTLGLFALNEAGLAGSMLQMINHGLSTGALFLLVGMLYERYHTRKLEEYGGLASKLKRLAVCMVFVCMSSVGLPGLNGFVGEALVFMGTVQVGPGGWIEGKFLAIIAAVGVLLGAWYLLSMLKQVFFGPLKEPAHGTHEVHDLNARELTALVPIMALCVVLGVYPQPVLKSFKPELKLVTSLVEKAKQHDTKSQRLAQQPTQEGQR